MFGTSAPSARGVGAARAGRSAVIAGRGAGAFFAGVAAGTAAIVSCLRTRVRALIDGALASVVLIGGLAAGGLERAGVTAFLLTSGWAVGFAVVFFDVPGADFSTAAVLAALFAGFLAVCLVAFFAFFFDAPRLTAAACVTGFLDFCAAFFLACFFAMTLPLFDSNS